MTEDRKFFIVLMTFYSLVGLTGAVYLLVKHGIWIMLGGLIGWTVIFGLLLVLFVIMGPRS